MEDKLEIGFLDHFEQLNDPRSERNRLYSMAEILLVSFCAAICGAEGWQDVEDFGKSKIDYLQQFLPYENGIPSDDTFRRFFRGLDPKKFQDLFSSWFQKLKGVASSVIAIDGKSSRHSFDDGNDMLHMISAYATEARLVLGQRKVAEKSNEITAIPELLNSLDIKGSVVTIDAMGCQYKIADQIIKQHGDYVFSLKGNQGELHEDVKYFFESLEKNENSIKVFSDTDKGHGRIEKRVCSISQDINWLTSRHHHWHSIKSIIRIQASRDIKGKVSSEIRYYISSLQVPASEMLAKIRSHWAIENSLHWILDMTFGEDQSRIRKENAPQNMAIIRHVALNLLQATKAQMKRQSIKRLRKAAGWDHSMLTSIIAQNFS